MTRRQSKDRRLGWRPPPQFAVHINEETYDFVKKTASAKNQNHAPFYDTLQSIILEFKQLKEDLELTKGFLALALDDKEAVKKENNEMRKLLN